MYMYFVYLMSVSYYKNKEACLSLEFYLSLLREYDCCEKMEFYYIWIGLHVFQPFLQKRTTINIPVCFFGQQCLQILVQLLKEGRYSSKSWYHCERR